MFKDVNFNTKKYIILMFIICLVFFVIVIKAFEYIPVADKELISEQSRIENINKTSQEQNTEADVVEEEKSSDKQKHVHIDFMKQQKETEEPIAEIQAPEGVDYEPSVQEKTNISNEEKQPELTSEQKALETLHRAKNHFNNGEYATSLKEYHSAVQLTKDDEIIASGYEGISKVYAANRKYGTALAFATKAYSISPSISREILLAKLYYKTGDIEKATKRVNNILHKDFSND